jgi:hypothetical protein
LTGVKHDAARALPNRFGQKALKQAGRRLYPDGIFDKRQRGLALGDRQAVGAAVFGGMLAAATIGIFLIPGLYRIAQGLRERAHALVGAGGGGKPSSETPAPASHP